MIIKSEDIIKSPLLGLTINPTEEDRVFIREIVEECPLGVFQELNKFLNRKGLRIKIEETIF